MDIAQIFFSLLEFTYKNKYPDIHIVSGKRPYIRNSSGELIDVNEIENENGVKEQIEAFSKNDVFEIIKILAGDDGAMKFIENFELDTSYAFKDIERYRVNCYMDTNGYSIAMRIIPREIPTLEQLGLGDVIKTMCSKSKGLILMTGPTGSGKSTNLAGMIDFINTNFKKHIITIEDPVEFSFESKKSLINQRELGNNTKSFENAMKSILREDPNIIMLGEMRDPETIRTALTLAETGHLVLSTLHTNDTVQTVDRIVDIFPGTQQEQIRMQLAMSLIGIISQRLVPREDKEGRIAAREILIANDAIRNLIITGKTHQLYSVLEVGQKEGMILMDKYLLALYKKNIISKDTLLSFARDKEILEMSV
ncbi:type IV pilus twitching motility protein PilT [Candidatus Gracilibacteria bacterium]|nr:type IV pilus twitching motility protein PilT [Candidatus Gracilibacteria bacterium]NUJ99252.1 type IV pilus twitching motility protein PilT [Candidatus Gracilibacteria bacterium]